MRKGRLLRLAGFGVALCTSAALVGAAVQTTGAYFTSTADGTITASSGHLTLSAQNTSLDFSNLMPGDNVTKTINYQVDASSGQIDLWLTFDPTSSAYQAFTGGKDSPNVPDGGLGRYGWFAVSESHWGQAFRSGNLAFPPYVANTGEHQTTYSSQTSPQCTVDATGRGGSDWIATAANGGDTTNEGYCGVPEQILLVSGLSNAASGSVNVTFGLNGWKQKDQNQPEFGGSVPFTLVATQHGQTP